MNNIVPITYLSLVYIMLLPIAYFITSQSLNFIYNIYTLRIFEKENHYEKYNYRQYTTLSQLYIKQKLWTLALNNLENALELKSTMPKEIVIKYIDEIGSIYSQINYKLLSCKYDNHKLKQIE
jgi:hypothetical protein